MILKYRNDTGQLKQLIKEIFMNEWLLQNTFKKYNCKSLDAWTESLMNVLI
jgi:hypothetical protein